MITQPTVLVLGAGASIPYGFPSGRDLYFQIKRNLDTQTREPNNQYLWGKLLSLGYSAGDIASFKSALDFADPLSVDAFLEHRNEFLPIGKLAIALTLIPLENPERLFNIGRGKDVQESWYRYLMGRLDANDCLDFRRNKLSIITFNYDRSLEHYLFTSLMNNFGINSEKCAHALSATPIIHVHGSLGSLPWQGKRWSRAYVGTDNLEVVQKASQEIVVMSEKEEEASVFDAAFDLLNEAEKIYFLGFGYHPTNLRRLKIRNLARKLNRHGTSVGMRQAELNSIDQAWGIGFHGADIGILDLFRSYVLPE